MDINVITNIITSSIFCYLTVCVLYNIIFALSSQLRQIRKYNEYIKKNRFVILIPSYKDDNIILNTARKVLDQDYPRQKYDVVVIADKLKSETLMQLQTMPLTVIRVSFEKSTKAKSLKLALLHLGENRYDSILILDSDNIPEPGCLEKANHALNSGFYVAQLHRTAKNKNTPTAVLDAISEEIGNAVHRKGHRALGLSSTLIGSGMAFDYSLLYTLMRDLVIEDNPAEDREINAELLRRGYICEYIDDALVLDEKVQSGRVLEKQRTRWISAQLRYAVQFWIKDVKHIFDYNINYFDYAFQTLLLPRILILALSLTMMLLSSIISLCFAQDLAPGPFWWGSLFIGCCISVVVPLKSHITIREFWIALLSLPATLWAFVNALLKSTPHQTEFIHTPKEFTK